MTRTIPLHAAPPAPDWLTRERSAAPADRPYLEEARRLVEGRCVKAGTAFAKQPEPWLSNTILALSRELRAIDKKVGRHRPESVDAPRWLSIKEAALRIGMSPSFIRDHLLQQDIPGITGKKHGDSWRVDAMALDEYLERQGG